MHTGELYSNSKFDHSGCPYGAVGTLVVSYFDLTVKDATITALS